MDSLLSIVYDQPVYQIWSLHIQFTHYESLTLIVEIRVVWGLGSPKVIGNITIR